MERQDTDTPGPHLAFRLEQCQFKEDDSDGARCSKSDRDCGDALHNASKMTGFLMDGALRLAADVSTNYILIPGSHAPCMCTCYSKPTVITL